MGKKKQTVKSNMFDCLLNDEYLKYYKIIVFCNMIKFH